MLRYMTSGPEANACQNCKFFIHHLSICWVNVPANEPKECGATYIEDQSLSPCKTWEKGYEYIEGGMKDGVYRLGKFVKTDPEAW